MGTFLKKLDIPDPNTDIPKVFGVTPERFRDMFEQLGEICYRFMTSLNELRISLDSKQWHPLSARGYLLPFRHIPKWLRDIPKQFKDIPELLGDIP